MGVPTKFINGFDLTNGLIEGWESLTTAEQSHLHGICFDTVKTELFTNEAVIGAAISAVASVVANHQDITTYTWRRTLPTIALNCNFSAIEQLAVGDWQDKNIQGPVGVAAMPTRYASSKAELSRTGKARFLALT